MPDIIYGEPPGILIHVLGISNRTFRSAFFAKEKIYTLGMLVMAIGFVGSALFTSPALLIASNILKGLGVGFAGGMALGMVADTVTFGRLKTGIDTVGMGNAGISAAQKPDPL